MLMYACKYCNQFFMKGYVNGFNEYFCSARCYEKYCKVYGYEFFSEHISPTETLKK